MENKWDIIATKAWTAIFSAVEAMREETGGKKKMSLDAIAKKIGAGNRSTIKGWLSGERGGKDIAFPDMLRYLENLGFDIADFIPMPTIRHMGVHSPKIVVGEGDKLIDVYQVAGAGQAWELVEMEPLVSIRAPVSFALQISFALLVQGDSMSPTLQRGSVVGVKAGDGFHSNEIYAVRPPDEGLSVKRVIRDHKKDGYILRSDNPDKTRYQDVFIPSALAEHLIVGRVVWVWQGV